MKKMLVVLFLFVTNFTAIAQNANVTWGEEFKMKKGSTDLSVIYADKDAVYLREGHMALKSYFVIGATTRESATLVKLDKSMEEVYRNDFNKELKGKEFEDFFFLQNKLFVLATDYDKKEKHLGLFAAEINKADGQLSSDWTEIDGWTKESNKEVIDFRVDYNGDSTKMIIVSTIEGKEKNSYNVKQVDLKLKTVAKPVKITNEFEPKTFQLEDVVYVTNGNIVMIGRVMEYQEGKKKKAKFLDFKNYLVRFYQPDGTLLKEINTQIESKWLLSTKVSQIKGKELVLAAFYSNTKKGKEVNGMMLQRIDPATAEIISTSHKELNTSLLSVVEDTDDNDDESRKERKERERLEKLKADEDGFSKNLRFRNFIPTTDGGLAIIAEEYHSYTYSVYQSGGGSTMSGINTGRWVTYRVFSSGDIMMSKMDVQGNLSWLNVLPKNQEERIQIGSSNMGSGFSIGFNYFDNTYGMPYYSGIASVAVPGKNSVAILFNDGSKNADVTKLGQKVKRTMRFSKSDFYMVSLDTDKGTYKREMIFSNDDIPPAMPRLGGKSW